MPKYAQVFRNVRYVIISYNLQNYKSAAEHYSLSFAIVV